MTGRTGRSFISGIDIDVERLSVQPFILYPGVKEGPFRVQHAEPETSPGTPR